MSSINTVQQDLQSDEALQNKINAARIAVNVITIFTVFIAVFMGVMLGVFNAAEPAEGVSENMNFLMGFSAIFFTIAIPSFLYFLISNVPYGNSRCHRDCICTSQLDASGEDDLDEK